MIVLELKDGIGNQLFQAALYEELCLIHGEDRVCLDVSGYRSGIYGPDRSLVLPELGIPFREAGEDLVKSLRGYTWGKSLWERAERKRAIWRARSGKSPETLYLEKSRVFDPEVLSPGLRQVYLSGYWQDERYFPRGGSILRGRIRLPEEGLDRQIKELLFRIRSVNSVSVHIRRGDYLKQPRRYGGVCTASYYQRAASYVSAKTEDPVFFLFSDDPSCFGTFAEILGQGQEEGPIPVSGSGTPLTDLLLMSACRHSIIANSTFSWWGAALGSEEGRIICAPDPWYGDGEKTGIARDGWIHIRGD